MIESHQNNGINAVSYTHLAIMSWVSQGRSPVEYVLMQLADPLLRPIRNLLPSMGGIDFSPMVLVDVYKRQRQLYVQPVERR